MMYRRMMTRYASVVLLLALLLPSLSLSVVRAEENATTDDEIVYVDSAGRIRVLDPNTAANAQAIQWESPDTGWYDIATGDVNADGEAEIIAIGNVNGTNKLTIFDPVVQANSGLTPDGYINNVPWKRLYEMALPGTANLVNAGNMDQFVAGDEIVVGYSFNEGNGIVYRMTVIKRTDAQGMNWTTHATSGFGAAWKWVEVGNIDGAGSADIVRLRDVSTSAMQAAQVDNNWATIFERNQDSFTYTTAVIGQFVPGGLNEVAITRTFPGTTEAVSVFIYQFVNNAWTTTGLEFPYFPHPHFSFFADINGNGDDELFWLRDVPSNAASPRMVMLNAGGDALPAFEVGLDADNGYRVAAGGDVDADGRDEIVLIRSNRIFQYNDPENGPTGNTRFWDVATNVRSLALSNVDAEGYTAAARFNVDVSSINVSLAAGTLSNAVQTIKLTASGLTPNIQFSVAEESNSDWFGISVSGNTTPADIYVGSFNATNLKPGVYSDRIVVQAVGVSVINSPLYIPVTLTVTEVDFTVSRTQISFGFPIDNPTPQQQSVAVTSPFGALTYSAALMPQPPFEAAIAALGEVPDFGYLTEEGDIVLQNAVGEEYRIEVPEDAQISAAAIIWPSVAWATVQSTGNIMPDTITVTATAGPMPQREEKAILLIVADERAGVYPNNIAIVKVTAIKDLFTGYMPMMRR